MLIDATHVEETRVAVVDDQRLVEFDYESKVRRQLKGNIFLAKVTRVEPSLQAAFVNFGGNRHGFLPFSEIHPDYFRIPVADREALLAAQAAELEEHDQESADDDEEMSDAEDVSAGPEGDDEDFIEEDIIEEVGGEDKPAPEDKEKKKKRTSRKAETEKDDDDIEEDVLEETETAEEESSLEEDSQEEETKEEKPRGRYRGRSRNRRAAAGSRRVEMVGGEGVDSDRPFRFNMRRQYKIQEVVKRGQIMLIQVSKEERGNKGAAVTTYLSLPGRYCVLMPNSPRGGGVSRKIANYKDRRRMKEVLAELNVPEGMSVILRTAGVSRTKAEIKRDLDYLTRLWNTIREDTLQASAPALINEEGNLIKRSIRDLYDKDIDEVQVAGSEGFKTAKSFMKMLMPSHTKYVQEYKDEKVPLFNRYNVESQISDIGQTTVRLKSGGYLVINPTEALVSIDVNSGKATKERHIEETALKTNLEAAVEVARQLRLRDLGGLVVIDFIDMEERRNNRKVEQKLSGALSSDRARIQVGRISSFGLLELSRQRMNPSLAEMQFEVCPHCQGEGSVPTLDFAAIKAIRALEDEGIKGTAAELSLNLPHDVGIYVLNHKRDMLAGIEARYDFRVHVRTDANMPQAEYKIEVLQKTGKAEKEAPKAARPADVETGEGESGKAEGTNRSRTGRRRGRRGGRRNKNPNAQMPQEDIGNRKPDTPKDVDGNVAVKEDSPQGNIKEEKPRRGRVARKAEDKKEDKSSAKKEPANPAKKPVQKPAEPSNDVTPPAPKDYETVNEAPKTKKKGWWNKLVE